MGNFSPLERLKSWLNRLEPFIEGLLFILSAAAVLLVVVNEFVPNQDMIVPYVGVTWQHFRWIVQVTTWSAFILDVTLYGLVSFHFFRYAKEHWLELTICVAWFPFQHDVLLQHFQNIASLQTFVLIGSVCHLIRMAKWTIQKFSQHPVVVILAAAVVLVTSGALVLMQVEPQTFGNFQDSAFFVVMTIFTVGSDLNPHTLAGRVVTGVLTAGGIALGMLFLTTLSRIIARRLFPGHDVNEKLLQQLDKNAELMTQLIAQQKEAASIDRQRLALLEEYVLNRLPCANEGTIEQPAETADSSGEHERL
jgi:hypothetical protein